MYELPGPVKRLSRRRSDPAVILAILGLLSTLIGIPAFWVFLSTVYKCS